MMSGAKGAITLSMTTFSMMTLSIAAFPMTKRKTTISITIVSKRVLDTVLLC